MNHKLVQLVVLLFAFSLFGCGGEEFSAEAWKQTSAADEPTKKLKLAESVHAGDLLIGLKRDKIIEILGKPDYESPDNIQYLLGKKSGPVTSVNSFLVIRYDENSLSCETLITRD